MRAEGYISTATEATRFYKELASVLASVLGLPKDAVIKRESFQVDTDAGILRGSLCEGERIMRGRYTPAWVHFRFEDVEAARAKLPHGWTDRLNGYSGKWNWNFYSSDADARNLMVAEMVRNLRNLNPRNPVLLDRRP